MHTTHVLKTWQSLRRYTLTVLVLTICLLWLMPAQLRAQLNRYYFYAKTQKLYERGEYTQAIGSISVFLEYQTEDEIGLYLRALCKYQLDDWRGAQLDLDKLLTRKPFMTEALLLRAAVRNQLEEYKAAMIDIRLASELRPNERDIQYMRGITHFFLEEYSEAIDDFSLTLQRNPEHLDARLNRGTAYLLSGDTVTALKDYNQAIQTNPYTAGPHINIARVYYAKRQYDNALEAIDKALQLSPKSGQALLIKALVEHDAGCTDCAIKTITQAIEYAPKSSLAYYNRAIMLAQKGELKAALRDYEEAARISPTNVFIRYNAGLTYTQLKRYQEAAEALSYAIALYPNFARAYTLRSDIRLKSGDVQGARADYDSAQQIIARFKHLDEKDLDKWSDTTANFSRLIAFENDFASSSDITLPSFLNDSDELLPLATIRIGQEQTYTEWAPVLRADSIVRAPYFALVVPSQDTLRRIEVGTLPPLTDVHAIRLVRAITLIDAHHYEEALPLLDSIPRHSAMYPLSQLLQATTQISQIRFAPTKLTITLPGSTTSAINPKPAPTADYSQPIALLETLNSEYAPSPYIYYSLGIVHYLARDLDASEKAFNQAITLEANFAEAFFNRALVRILLHKNNQACLDLSIAGQLGIDRAYRVIADHCKR